MYQVLSMFENMSTEKEHFLGLAIRDNLRYGLSTPIVYFL